MPAPAPTVLPIAARLGAAEDAADDRATDGAAADLRRALAARGIAFAQHGLGLNRKPGAVRQDDRREPHAEPRPFAHASATLDQRHYALRARAGGNHHAIADLDIARHAGDDLVLEARAFAGDRGFHLQTDHRLRRDDQFLQYGAGGSIGRDAWLCSESTVRGRSPATLRVLARAAREQVR